MPTHQRGQNAKIYRELTYSNGTTPLPLSALEYLSGEIVQYSRVIASYVLTPTPTPVQGQIEAGRTASEVLVHLTESVSANLREGPVYIRIKMRKADTTYYDPDQYDIDEHTPFSIIN